MTNRGSPRVLGRIVTSDSAVWPLRAATGTLTVLVIELVVDVMTASGPTSISRPSKDGEQPNGRGAFAAHLDAIAADSESTVDKADIVLADRESTRGALTRIYRQLGAIDYAALPATGVREEIGKFIALLPDLPSLRDPFVIQEAEVAAASLSASAGSGDPSFARMIRKDLERRLSKARLDRLPPAVWLMVGLVGVVIPLIAVVMWVLAQSGSGGLFAAYGNSLAGYHPVTWVIMAVAGSLGGGMSVLTRITTFEAVRGNRWVLVITGFSKPLIGAVFAMFVFALLIGGLIPIQQPPGPPATPTPEAVALQAAAWGEWVAICLAISFLAGFSERFVPDLTGNLERTYVTKVKNS